MTKPLPQGENYIKRITPYTVFLQHTNEKEICTQTLRRAIEPQIDSLQAEGSRVWKYADIGCGSGEIVSMLLTSVSTDYPDMVIQGTFVEPSKLLLDRTEDVLRRIPGVHWCLINMPVEALLPEELAPWGGNDFVLCSHTLPYVEDWLTQIQKMLKSLGRGGRACFVLHSASSQVLRTTHFFLASINRLEEFPIAAEDVEEGLAGLGIDYTSESVMSSVVFPLADALAMPLSPDAFTEAGHNIAFDLTRFYTFPNYWHLATPETLKEIKQFYLNNRRGDEIHLSIHEVNIYCDGYSQG